MKVHGHPTSGCTRKVLATMFEVGLTPVLHVVELTQGEHKRLPHTALQPFGKVPALVDDFVLYESQAIMRYVAGRYGKGVGLVPSDVRERARMDQFLSVGPDYFGPAGWLFMKNLVLAPMFGPLNVDDVARGRRDIAHGLDVLERALEGRDYLARTFSLADIEFMPRLQLLCDAKQDDLIHNRPLVASWWSRLRDRRSWRATLTMGVVDVAARAQHAA
jgi:glutathione S-transferase